MPTFDPSSSRPGRSDADLLRSVLGPARPVATSLRAASRDYRRRQRRGRIKRALVVATLVGSFCGSALLLSENRPSTTAVAARISPAGLDPETTGSVAKARVSAQDPARRSFEWSLPNNGAPGAVSELVK